MSQSEVISEAPGDPIWDFPYPQNNRPWEGHNEFLRSFFSFFRNLRMAPVAGLCEAGTV
jgi:hypothetical protein